MGCYFYAPFLESQVCKDCVRSQELLHGHRSLYGHSLIHVLQDHKISHMRLLLVQQMYTLDTFDHFSIGIGVFDLK